MKRMLIALGIAGVMFGGVYGLAASLNVSSATLGAGTAAVAACQSGTVNVTYTPTYSATATAGYRATDVTLTGTSDASLGEQTGTTPSTGTTHTMTFSGVSAAAVTGVHVTIYG
jgi:hypothetical protein